jgi:AraC-like DNA-binding protein
MNSPGTKLCEIHSLGKSTRENLVGSRQVKCLSTSKILFAGFTDAGPGYRFVRHAPDFHQILACTGGEGRVFLNDGWHACSAGFAYLTASQSFCAYEIERGSRWQLCWLIYQQQAALPNLAVGTPPRLVQADTQGLQHAIVGLCHEASAETDPAALELWSTLVHRQSLRILQPGDTDPRLDKLWLLVRHDLGGPWNLQRLAHTAGLSAESLRRLCLEHHGAPPLTHLTRLRMQYAADLLACTREKISAIAARVGYDDAFAFSNAFKRVLGQPPSHHRGLKK